MQHLNELIFLIDAASQRLGNDAKLAAALGQNRSKVSDWRKGRQPCPPEMQALMAAAAGFNPEQVAIRALVEKHEGTELGDKLLRVLGKPSLVIGAALGSAGAAAHGIGSMILEQIQCIKRRFAIYNNGYVKRFQLEKM